MAAFFSCFQILTLTSFAYSLKLRREKFPHVKVIFQSVLNRDIQYVSPKEVVKRYLPPCYCTFNYNNYKTIIVCSKKKLLVKHLTYLKKNTALALIKTR